jgi:hypothetical protein
MSPDAEANMSVLKRLWTRIARFAEALEGIDDPRGDYIFAVGERVDKLEREVAHLGNCIRAVAAAGYSFRQRLKPRFTLIDRCWQRSASCTILRLTDDRAG